MKRITLTFIILISGFSLVKSQDFDPVLYSDTTQWNFFTDFKVADMLSTTVFKAYEDTLIGTVNYRRIYEDYLGEKGLYGFLKEDTVMGRLWLRLPSDTTNYLIMDLSLDLDDSFILKSVLGEAYNSEYVVKEVSDTAGRRLLLEKEANGHQIRFMEGIGPDFIFHMIEEEWMYYELLCAYRDNVTIFFNPDLPCVVDDQYVGTSPVKELKINVYPVPATGILTVEFSGSAGSVKEIEFFSLTGMKLFTMESAGSRVNMDLSAYPPGLYFIRINKQYVSKVVVDR